MTIAGRRLAVRKSELGNSTRTMSPRAVFIVDGGFWTFPIFCKRFQTGAELGSLLLADAARRKINVLGFQESHQNRRLSDFRRTFGKLHLAIFVCAFDRQHKNDIITGWLESEARLQTEITSRIMHGAMAS